MPQTIPLVVDHRIRLVLDDVPADLERNLREALEIPNAEKIKQLEQHVYGANLLPDEIQMWDMHGDVLDMPRGFLPNLLTGLEATGYQPTVEDNRSYPAALGVGKVISPRNHQEEAVQAILDNEIGIYKAPPGSGKTCTVLMAGKRARTKCLIIVNTKDIMYQWENRIHQHLGDHIPVGLIGDNKFEIASHWTVATAQTLHSRYDQLEADGFFREFGFVCLDEMHHATAETYNRIMGRFESKLRFGVSATPDKTGDFALAKLVLGDIIHVTEHDGLIDAGYLIKVDIIKVKTNFTFSFRGTTNRHSRSNYPQLVEALMLNEERNNAIIGALLEEEGHHCLVLTKRHQHIDLLEAMLQEAGYQYETAKLTGKEKTAERKRVIELANGTEPFTIFSTIADEALDVPRIDRGFLVFPQKNTGLIEQQVGRFARTHPDKPDSKVYDFADLHVGPLRTQWRSRLYGVYRKQNFRVIPKTVEDFIERD